MSTEVKKKKIAKTQIHKGNKRGDKIPRYGILSLVTRYHSLVSCPEDKITQRWARCHVVLVPGGQDKLLQRTRKFDKGK